MKYQIEYIIDESKTTKERIRDIKLQLIEEDVNMVITSDFPIPIASNNSIIFLGTIKCFVTSMETHIIHNLYIIKIKLCDEETIKLKREIDEMEAKRKASMEYDAKRKYLEQRQYNDWSMGRKLQKY